MKTLRYCVLATLLVPSMAAGGQAPEQFQSGLTLVDSLRISYYYSYIHDGPLETWLRFGETLTIHDGGGCDIARCEADDDGRLRAFNLDCGSTGPGTYGGWVSFGCSTAREGGYTVECCIPSTLGQAPEILWSRTYSDSTVASTVAQTSDGGFALGGVRYHNRAVEPDYDLTWFPLLIRTDASGQLLWSKTFATEFAGVKGLAETADGGLALLVEVGETESSLIRTDGDGQTLWTRFFQEDFIHLLRTQDGGFALIDEGWGTGCVLLRTDGEGNELWTRFFDLDDSVSWMTCSGTATSDNGFALACSVGPTEQPPYEAAILVRIDAGGNTLWTQKLSLNTSNPCEGLGSIVQTADGGFAAAGRDCGDSLAGLLVRTDAGGHELWRVYGVFGNGWHDLVQMADGGFVLVGDGFRSTVDAVAAQYDAEGRLLWTKYFDHLNQDGLWDIELTSDGSVVLAGAGGFDDAFTAVAWLVRLDAIATDVWPEQTTHAFRLEQNYPNPFNPTTTISYDLPRMSEATLTVYDVLGREVRELASGAQPAGTYEVLFDATGLPSGVYFYRLVAGDFVKTNRMVVLK